MRRAIGTAAMSVLAVAMLAACAGSPKQDAGGEAASPAQHAADGGDVDVGGGMVGTLGGAPYRVDRPADWNGTLIVYAHGFEMPGTPRPDEVPQDAFGEWALSKGFAIARSAYSTAGWAVAEAVPESEAVRRLAVESFGAPKRTYVIGHSLGAHIALASLEAHPAAYDGALALCGVNAPAAETFAVGVLAPLVAAEALVPGAMPVGGLDAADAPPVLDPAALEAALAADEADASRIADRFEIPRPGLAGGLWLRYVALRDAIARGGGFPVDNRDTRYTGLGDDAAFNAAVRRYAGDPGAMAYVAAHADLQGSAPKPVVVLSNVTDPSVTPSISRRYAELAAASGRAANVLTLPPSGDGHCAFDDVAVDSAFETLRTWVETGRRPAP